MLEISKINRKVVRQHAKVVRKYFVLTPVSSLLLLNSCNRWDIAKDLLFHLNKPIKQTNKYLFVEHYLRIKINIWHRRSLYLARDSEANKTEMYRLQLT